MKKLLTLCLIVGILGFSWNPVNAEQPKDIVIGIIGDLSGPTSSTAGMAVGKRDYFLYLNDRGGINGHPLDITLIDGAEIIPAAVASYKRIIELNPHIISTWGTGGTKAVRKYVSHRDKVPNCSIGSSGSLVRPKEFPYDFIFGPTYEDQVKLAMLMAKKEGAKKVAYMGPTLDYGMGTMDNILKEGFFKKNNLELVIKIYYSPKPTDLTPELLRLKKLRPDFVFVQDTSEGVIAAIRSAKKVDFDVSKFFIFFFSVHKGVISACGEDANGVRGFQLTPPPEKFKGTPVGKEMGDFLKKHRRRGVDTWYGRGWLAGKCMAEGVKQALNKANNKVPNDIFAFRKTIRDELEGLRDFDIGAGPDFPRINYADHKGFVAARVMKIVDKKWVPITKYLSITSRKK
ncbi:MAG TPA: hypothetical protein ENF36_01530 [Desulfobacteraceae bacterium]|nr:hypothetical protein [Desulfobacteraceae bacterium]